MAAEDYHNMDDYGDQQYWEQFNDEDDIHSQIRQFHRRMIMNHQNKYKQNKFYVGSNTVLSRVWGHSTESAAIKHAQELLEEQDKDEVFIVKIIKVIRRKKAPIEVISVK